LRRECEDERIGGQGALATQFEGALHAFDVAAAEALVHRALEDGLTPAEICTQMIAPALDAAGGEHLATGVAYRALDVVAQAARAAATPKRERILLATADGADHGLALHMVATVLECSGYEVVGPANDLPGEALASWVSAQRPSVVGLAGTLNSSDGLLYDAIHAVRDTDPDVDLVLVGDVEDTAEAVEGLLQP
jgi:methanogenic corrinoid protein MtbC1